MRCTAAAMLENEARYLNYEKNKEHTMTTKGVKLGWGATHRSLNKCCELLHISTSGDTVASARVKASTPLDDNTDARCSEEKNRNEVETGIFYRIAVCLSVIS